MQLTGWKEMLSCMEKTVNQWRCLVIVTVCLQSISMIMLSFCLSPSFFPVLYVSSSPFLPLPDSVPGCVFLPLSIEPVLPPAVFFTL